MKDIIVEQPFKMPFLHSFVFTPSVLPFTDEEILRFDTELGTYEQIFLNPDIERTLISKNLLLASFAISKAEQSSLTLTEAQEVYATLISDPEYDFVGSKLKKKQKLTQKDYEKLEFFNIAKTFRAFNLQPFTFKDVNADLIKTIHRQLTQGMDIFHDHLSDFTVYKSGKWRDNDTIRVGEYIPAPYKEIPGAISELVTWVKQHQTVTGLAMFHTALYALHPFHNGNKRVCRVLEHILLRQIGLNKKNLYSTSYYYHKEKSRYYKYLLYSLERKNLNHFVIFTQEAIVLSIISVVKTSLEAKRSEFLTRQNTDDFLYQILKPLIKRHELQFKHLFRAVKKKMARQTFVTNLQKAVDSGTVTRREAGRSTYYRLNVSSPEETTLHSWIDTAKKRLSYVPDDILLT